MISYIRRAADADDFVVIICNFTPVVRSNYRIGVPGTGIYQEILNTDSTYYGGSNLGNGTHTQTENVSAHGYLQSLKLTLPPLGVLVLRPATEA